MQILKQFDILLTEIVLLSLDEMRLVLGEISHKLDEIKAEIGEGLPPPPLFVELAPSACTGDEDQSDLVVVLDESNYKVEEDSGGNLVGNEIVSGEINCVWVVPPSGSGLDGDQLDGDQRETDDGDDSRQTVCVKVASDTENRLDSDNELEGEPTGEDSDPDDAGLDVWRPTDTSTKQTGRRCSYCDQEFDTKSSLAVHMRTIHRSVSVDVYSCGSCNRQFRSHNGLIYHVQSKHAAEEAAPRYRCERPECQYRTGSRVLLRAHLYSHTVNAPLTCPVCGKDFLGKFWYAMDSSIFQKCKNLHQCI